MSQQKFMTISTNPSLDIRNLEVIGYRGRCTLLRWGRAVFSPTLCATSNFKVKKPNHLKISAPPILIPILIHIKKRVITG